MAAPPLSRLRELPLRLCRLTEIEDGEGKSLQVHDRSGPRELVLLRDGATVYGYLNSCPHLGVPLEMVPDRFMNAAGTHAICRTHGALFEPATGYCISGPCAGQSLTAIDVELDDEGWLLLTAPLPASG
ncbi:Rieske (2Fe-2S) protein [Algihabitans albus]|uniref:Rieske (2Fe-2S) protein n=1 Tax=Algihabitans albus TaxID=2164067 RepID=UPI000E5C580A|nr:Rieske 2Fe-2S domain-containing protein [Algihabitans albus]